MTGFTAGSIMPYGKHQGKAMSDIPADYLLWLYDNGKCSLRVAAYIEDNLKILRYEADEALRKKNNRDMLRMMCK